MIDEVYKLFTKPLWLEDSPTFVEEEYWCPGIRSIDYLSQTGNFEEMKLIDLIFEEWEIKQMEMFVDGLGNVVVEKKNYYSRLAESLEKIRQQSITNNSVVIASQQVCSGVGIPPHYFSGIEYTPSTYKYHKRQKS
jgi:hypothetical protein